MRLDCSARTAVESTRGPRPPVDIVIPFLGDQAAFDALISSMERLARGPQDRLIIVDNNPPDRSVSCSRRDIECIGAPEVQSSYYARNRGIAEGTAAWVIFLDADVTPERNLIDRYFDPPPLASTGILAGAILDETPPGCRSTLATRYATSRRMHEVGQMLDVNGGFAQTANCAIRRETIADIGGFAIVRSSGDAEFCFRAHAAGWSIESTPARVVHYGRSTIVGLLRKKLRYGAGARWLASMSLATFRPASPLRLALRWARFTSRAAIAFGRGSGSESLMILVDVACDTAFAIGYHLPNTPGTTYAWLRTWFEGSASGRRT